MYKGGGPEISRSRSLSRDVRMINRVLACRHAETDHLRTLSKVIRERNAAGPQVDDVDT
jgi:hypothetical protein